MPVMLPESKGQPMKILRRQSGEAEVSSNPFATPTLEEDGWPGPRSSPQQAVIPTALSQGYSCRNNWIRMILGNCSTWKTNSFQCIYLFIVLYMFRACHAHHQEKQIVSIQLLVIVTPCWWQCRVLAGSKLPTSTLHCHQHGVTITRSCIDIICFSWWWAWHVRNM